MAATWEVELVNLMSDRRVMTAALIAALGIGVGGVTGTSLAWFQDADTQEAVDQAKGQAALNEGREHLDAHRWRQAIEAFEEALTYLPGNEEALAGIRQAQTELNEAPIIRPVEEELQVQLGRARAEFNASMQRAQDLLGQGDYNGAEREALTAQIRLRQARNLFSTREYSTLSQQAETLLGEIDREREAFEQQERLRIDKEAEQAQREARAREAQQRKQIIEENLRRVRQLQMELKYGEALQVIDEILFIDEHNPAALVLRDVIRTTMLYRQFAEAQRQQEMGYGQLAMEAEQALVPPHPNTSGPGDRSLNGIMAYPEDWSQLSLRRTHELGFRESAANRRVSQVLTQTRIPVDFEGNTFEQVTDYMARVTGENVYVDWKALDFIGVNRDDQVNLQLNDVSAAVALDRILEQVGDELDRPQWAIQDGIVTISSDEALRQHTVSIVYDIRDLLFEVPYFGNAPEVDLSKALNQAPAGTGGGFGGGGLGGGGQGGGGAGQTGGAVFGDPADEPPRISREELVEQIVGIIQENIDPEGWRDLGGDTGTLQELNGNLIITNTLRNHGEIEGLLSQLREIRALQINVESRFLAVSTDWFEQIGVDLDLYFNTNNDLRQQQLAMDPLGHLSDLFDPNTGQLRDPFLYGQVFDPITGDLVANRPPWGSIIGVPGGQTNGYPTYTWTPTGPVAPLRTTEGFAPISVVQDSLGIINSVADLSGFGEAVMLANPAIAVGIQFLDDVQVDLLIEATQADRRSVVLTAPRLTFFNGQRAWVAVANQVAFVSALIPITGDAAGAFQPIPGVVNEGVVLDVEGVISADRRYVTMTVIVSLAEIVDIRELEVQGAVGGVGDIAGGATFSATQELPEVQVSLVQTTVSVPDKGTVLLGGTRRVDEIEVEAGVPVLSKIPFINRFFTNRLTSKSEKTLLILIRPEIIIQQEHEDLLFPGLSDSLGGAASYLQ
jgi:general secretion pathway protein D